MKAALARIALLCVAALCFCGASELSFEMDEHSSQCFYDTVAPGVRFSVEHEVIYGGRRDVDIVVRLGDRQLYQAHKSSESRNEFVDVSGGMLEVCFSNEFSTISHKTVYLEVVVGNAEDPLAAEAAGQHLTFTQIETSIATVHDALKHVSSFQTHHRMQEATHRYTAEGINDRVQWVSAYETLLLIVVSLFQVLYLRSLFSERPDRF